MKKSKFFKILIITAFVFCTGPFMPALGVPGDAPFYPGEKMTFQVKWCCIVAGEATIELLPLADINGNDAYHFLLTARTSEFVDIFYKVRDRIESYTDLNMTHSLSYIKRHEGRSKKEINVNFDWENLQAQFSTVGETKKRELLSIMPGTFDPLSVFFAFRLNELEENKGISIPVTDGKKMVMGNANVVKREVVTIEGTEYDTFLVEPDLGDIGGVFEKSKDARLQIWVTADNRRIPVMIKSKVVVGSFVAELKSYYEGAVSERSSK